MLPVSFFEKAGNAYYNSIAIVDADGAVLGVYRKVKTHTHQSNPEPPTPSCWMDR